MGAYLVRVSTPTPETEDMTATMHPSMTAPRITLDDLAAIEFVTGAGSRDNGLCIMTAAAWLAGEPHGDSPTCVSPVIRRLLIGFHDRCDAEVRQRADYKALAQEIVGTGPETAPAARQRAFMCADWAVRVVAPLALDAAGKPELAALLRGVGAVVDRATAALARDAARKVQGAADADADAAAAAAAAADAAADADAYAADAAYAAAAYAADAASYVGGHMWSTLMDSLIPLVKRMASLTVDEIDGAGAA